MDHFTHLIINAALKGALGAAFLWILFFLFCRFSLRNLLGKFIRDPRCIEIFQALVEGGVDNVLDAFKRKIPLVGMFLGPEKEVQLKQIAITELVGKGPKVHREALEAIVDLIQRKGSPFVALAGFLVGFFVSFFKI